MSHCSPSVDKKCYDLVETSTRRTVIGSVGYKGSISVDSISYSNVDREFKQCKPKPTAACIPLIEIITISHYLKFPYLMKKASTCSQSEKGCSYKTDTSKLR